MLDKSKTYLIVGLGLLGGKYAQVLSQKGYNVTGITHSQSTLDYALQHDYIRAGKNADFEDLVKEADCIIFGLYPTVLLDWVKQYGQLIRPGTMVTDVSGVKRGVVEPVQAALPEGVEFIASTVAAARRAASPHSARGQLCPRKLHHHPDGKEQPGRHRLVPRPGRGAGLQAHQRADPRRARPHDRLRQPALPCHCRQPDVRVR